MIPEARDSDSLPVQGAAKTQHRWPKVPDTRSTRSRRVPESREPRAAALVNLVAVLLVPACAPTPQRSSPSQFRSPSVVESTVPWQFESADGALIRTRHYRLFTTDASSLRHSLPEFLELALNQYTSALATPALPRPDLKLDTFLMADRSQWSSLTRQIMGINAGPYLRIQRGGFSSGGRALLFAIGPRDTLAIAAHEGWHQYTQRAFKDELPVWLEEGIAAYMEGFTFDAGSSGPSGEPMPVFKPWANPERFEQLGAAVKAERVMPLRQLLDTSPTALLAFDTDTALTYYAQTWALVLFLVEGPGSASYAPSLSRILHDASSGRLRPAIDRRLGAGASQLLARERRGPELFSAYFTSDLAAAEVAYDGFLRMIARGSKDRILMGVPPYEPHAR